ncbi:MULTISPECIES: DUF4405 domain-containing protein [unclassified Fibrobacter]|uniref:DUF4405 domain-containing protein n=1 Tax=unclassified Fibrobacter TaxID=2634177 RepID=UPI000D6DA7A0|nr:MULTISPECIES: DUF4405 domain-containing protein [unclassified Fibrobacter]PWJ61920.1 uncharacterized protein DUF4405 [Fibrobacter sp. UWR4]PZW67458.1 uncharacterized protein DUF4405 [Fibrobacter sp. UWR1]
MKRTAKIIIDVLMYSCFLYLMSYGAIHDLTSHGYVGIALFVLFVVHHGMNFWFYRSMAKGKWNARRIAMNVMDWILFALMITMAVSSIFMTGLVFEWSPMKATQTAREVHLASCCWGFMVMLFHLGFHLDTKLDKLENFCRSRIWKMSLLSIAYGLLISAGVYGFVQSQLYVYMFVTGGWKLAAESVSAAVLQLLGISAGMCIMTHLGMKLLKKS